MTVALICYRPLKVSTQNLLGGGEVLFTSEVINFLNFLVFEKILFILARNLKNIF